MGVLTLRNGEQIMIYPKDVKTKYSDVEAYLFRILREPGTTNFYLGITGDYNGRFEEEHKDYYDDMYLLYKHNNEDQIRNVEKVLIAFARKIESAVKAKCDNEKDGGEGKLETPPVDGYYYVYVVVTKA